MYGAPLMAIFPPQVACNLLEEDIVRRIDRPELLKTTSRAEKGNNGAKSPRVA